MNRLHLEIWFKQWYFNNPSHLWLACLILFKSSKLKRKRTYIICNAKDFRCQTLECDSSK